MIAENITSLKNPHYTPDSTREEISMQSEVEDVDSGMQVD